MSEWRTPQDRTSFLVSSSRVRRSYSNGRAKYRPSTYQHSVTKASSSWIILRQGIQGTSTVLSQRRLRLSSQNTVPWSLLDDPIVMTSTGPKLTIAIPYPWINTPVGTIGPRNARMSSIDVNIRGFQYIGYVNRQLIQCGFRRIVSKGLIGMIQLPDMA